MHASIKPIMMPSMATSRRFRRPDRVVLTMIACLLPMVVCGDCDRRANGAKGGAALAHTDVRVDKTKALAGDSITVKWKFTGEDKLQKQRIRLLTLGMAGLSTQDISLEKTRRSYTFTFERPTTVVLEATDKSGKATDVAFDVGWDTDYHFTINDLVCTWNQYPRIGHSWRGPRNNGRISLTFTEFYGVYEKCEYDDNGFAIEDGVIDDFANDDRISQALPRDQSFFARSWRVEEADRFGVRLGSAFPFLNMNFLLTDEGSQFLMSRTNADAFVLAGKIAYYGQTVPVKKGVTNVRLQRDNVAFEAIFAMIDLRSNEDGSQVYIADVHLGNLEQGLVLSLYHGMEPYPAHERGYGDGSVSYSFEPGSEAGNISGHIKGCTVGWGVTTRSGNILTSNVGGLEVPFVYAGAASIDFYAPFYPDDGLVD